MADFTGRTERAYILHSTTGIGALAGGRVYNGGVPDHIQLERVARGAVDPYIVTHFQTPFASMNGRSVASGEQDQPYVMTFNIVSYAASMDDAEELDADVRLILIGKIPSTTAGFIRSSGGYADAQRDTASRPTRFGVGSLMRVAINL